MNTPALGDAVVERPNPATIVAFQAEIAQFPFKPSDLRLKYRNAELLYYSLGAWVDIAEYRNTGMRENGKDEKQQNRKAVIQ